MHRYEAIGEWITKLLPEDLLCLIDRLVFTSQARTIVSTYHVYVSISSYVTACNWITIEYTVL